MQMVVHTDNGARPYYHLYDEGQTDTIWNSIEERDFDKFQSLIKQFGNINQKNPENDSLVSFALRCNAYQILEELIRLGAIVTESDVSQSFEKRDRQYSKLIFKTFVDQSKKNRLEKEQDKINQMLHTQQPLWTTLQEEQAPPANDEKQIGIKDKIRTMEQELQHLTSLISLVSTPYSQEQVDQKEQAPPANDEKQIGIKDKIKTIERRMQELKNRISSLSTPYFQEQVDQQEAPTLVDNKQNIGVEGKKKPVEQHRQHIASESKEDLPLANEVSNNSTKLNRAQKIKNNLDNVGLSGMLVDLIKHRFFK